MSHASWAFPIGVILQILGVGTLWLITSRFAEGMTFNIPMDEIEDLVEERKQARREGQSPMTVRPLFQELPEVEMIYWARRISKAAITLILMGLGLELVGLAPEAWVDRMVEMVLGVPSALLSVVMWIDHFLVDPSDGLRRGRVLWLGIGFLLIGLLYLVGIRKAPCLRVQDINPEFERGGEGDSSDQELKLDWTILNGGWQLALSVLAGVRMGGSGSINPRQHTIEQIPGGDEVGFETRISGTGLVTPGDPLRLVIATVPSWGRGEEARIEMRMEGGERQMEITKDTIGLWENLSLRFQARFSRNRYRPWWFKPKRWVEHPETYEVMRHYDYTRREDE